jgi:hypothetical protein
LGPVLAVRVGTDMAANPSPDASWASGLPPSPAAPPRAQVTDDSVLAEARATVALANQMFGQPEPLVLLRHEGALRVMGWILGRGRADCRQAGRVAHIVGVDVMLFGDGHYAVAQRTATDTADGLSRLDARCEVFRSADAVRRYCLEAACDEIRRAARVTALDHAVRRWPPLRGVPPADRLVPMPFLLD